MTPKGSAKIVHNAHMDLLEELFEALELVQHVQNDLNSITKAVDDLRHMMDENGDYTLQSNKSQTLEILTDMEQLISKISATLEATAKTA